MCVYFMYDFNINNNKIIIMTTATATHTQRCRLRNQETFVPSTDSARRRLLLAAVVEHVLPATRH